MISPLPESARARVGRAADTSACTLIGEVSAATGRDLIAVDVRAADDYARAAIPGAVLMSVDQIPASALLRSGRAVVVFGSGKDTSSLLRRCARWREQGLTNVRIFDGGMPAWARAGGLVKGDAALLAKPVVLQPQELYAIAHESDAALVFAHGKPSAAFSQVPAQIAVGATRSSLPRVARSLKRGADLVVFVADEKAVQAWRATARAAGAREPLFFIGDTARYDAYAREQASIVANANRPLPSACERGRGSAG